MPTKRTTGRTAAANRAREVLIDAAARILAEQGPGALTVRRMAEAAGTSTMAVYTHFGSMDVVVQEVLRTSTLNLYKVLQRAPRTDDPVADVSTLGRIYRGLALRRPYIFVAAANRALLAAPDETAAGEANLQPRGLTWTTLVEGVERCIGSGRFRDQDSELCAYVNWSTVHGFVSLELSSQTLDTKDPELPFETALLSLAIGAGDTPERAAASVAASKEDYGSWDLMPEDDTTT
ncbi:TetR/AcrR family transcriptional regulator [Streptomyces aureus]|uniref:TetR/AcrR family transcriptional regulator n=1 Tax=Streptomyces aureus TaxID=193461 RepID=UPI0006912790|nr:TetR/AcrR family transcriptional regulator [Streptomyces aureus]